MDQESITAILNEFHTNLGLLKGPSELESVRVKYLGKAGKIAKLFEEFSTLPVDQKKQLAYCRFNDNFSADDACAYLYRSQL